MNVQTNRNSKGEWYGNTELNYFDLVECTWRFFA